MGERCKQFLAIDEDGDGFIQVDEALAHFKKQPRPDGMPPPTEEIAKMMIDNSDKDGDGQNSFEEFAGPPPPNQG